MITVLIAGKNEKAKEVITSMLEKIGNTNIDIIKQEGIIKIVEKDSVKDMVSLEEKIVELEESLYSQKHGQLYKAVLEKIEKPLIEHILERTEGNQLKAARILGMNRNTIRAKIKRLGINASRWKIIQ